MLTYVDLVDRGSHSVHTFFHFGQLHITFRWLGRVNPCPDYHQNAMFVLISLGESWNPHEPKVSLILDP